uniref:Uncharacterized protein n=1 Tax=Rhizophora mucronata TaxID=61149 RepID=A0A2P2MX96_RHIMU
MRKESLIYCSIIHSVHATSPIPVYKEGNKIKFSTIDPRT